MEELKVIASLVQAIAVMALLSFVFGVLERSSLNRVQRSLLLGAVFGLAAIIAMLSPTQLGGGGQIDGRSIIVGLGAAFGGIPAAIVASVVAGSFRYFVVGGPLAQVGTLGIFLAAGLGILWMALCRCKGRPNPLQLGVAGVLISLQAVAVFLMPWDWAINFLQHIYPIMFAGTVSGALILGSLIARERGILDTEHQWKLRAEVDPLTGVHNRRYIESAFEDLNKTSQGDGDFHAMLLLDIDHFKQVNDTFGHSAGDEALKFVAMTLRQNTKRSDIVARVGGEEFCIMLPNTSEADAKTFGEKLLLNLERTPVIVGNATINLTASAGVSQFWSGQSSYDEIFACADRALYRAKQTGRNRILIANTKLAA